MGRQYRPPRRGTPNRFVQPYLTSSSSTAIAIPNYGVTDLSTFAAGDYVMDAPEEGVRKVLISVSSTSVARVIRAATDASVKIGTQQATQITFGQTTVACSIELLGVNTTQWVVLNTQPTASTGPGLAWATS